MTMDSSNAYKQQHQQLIKQRDDLGKKIIDNLAELYFLRNHGQMCDFQTWFANTRTKDKSLAPILDAKEEDLKDDHKFSQLLNLKFEQPLIVETKRTLNDSSITPPQEKKAREGSPARAHSGSTHSDGRVEQQKRVLGDTAIEEGNFGTSCFKKHATQELLEPNKEPLVSDTVEVEEQPEEIKDKAKLNKTEQSLIKSESDAGEPMEVDVIKPARADVDTDMREFAESTPLTEDNSQTEKSDKEQQIDCIVSQMTPVEQYAVKFLETIQHDNFRNRVDKPANQRISSKSTSKDDSPTRISKVVEPIVTTSAANAETNQRLNAERVKHEAAVLARVQELRKLGLWSTKRLPKCQDPPRPKAHWDYLLEEARWLHNDYRLERKWKRDAARRIAYAAYRWVNNKRTQEERIEREKIQHIRKIAATLSKEVRSFWSSIEKIVDFRQQTKLEDTRKKAWGLHLNYILDQTSKFSNSYVEDQLQPQVEDSQMQSQEEQRQDLDQDQKPLTNNQPSIEQSNDNGNDESKLKDSVINNDEQTLSKQRVDDMAAGAESIQPKGNTFETTTVSTKVPFLLKHQLREYQHIGLDWLVAMYKKQLNGILADEMGLGKTIQTIALLAYLACEEQDWGPHLIVVPTSVMLNWEMEFKKWCPAFKILTYYGTPKERKMKRVGWSRPNSFHVCITSYRIVIQDHAAFRRKQWSYLILDEAHYIKNFKSQRWQMLLNFNSQRRLLLTGTPLQNDLMELWSLMHFLMPSLFDSLREFKDWFVNPLTGMIEGSHEYNQELVQRLHKVLRPFLLRRLKADVEKQLPKKKEIIKYCRLSKRQRFLYEEFMSLSKTKETLASGNFLSVINVLMQLRKVCNHPNLFEPRPIVSPFRMNSIAYRVPGLLTSTVDYNPESNVSLKSLQLSLVDNGSTLTSLAQNYIKSKRAPKVILLENCCDQSTDVLDQEMTDDNSSVMEVDDTTDVVNSQQISEAYTVLQDRLDEEKRSKVQFLAELNDARCGRAHSLYYKDLEDIVLLHRIDKMVRSGEFNVFSNGNGRLLANLVSEFRDNPNFKLNYLTKLLNETIKSPEQIVNSLTDIIDRFIFCVPLVTASPVSMHVTHQNPSRMVKEMHMQQTLYNSLSPKFNFLNKIIVNMRMTFPELRLIEYDCGKLQALGQLLIDLKSNDHRVLIFTQMSRMLDILEQFLNYHGHTYLRLDGATKIDQRQILMERFNNDRKIFCFILSTRSGGIGVNLTGADTVIFYDSDWNPTMDAQAQDRCHRIGQTRDVYIYRLISEDTIEQNIYRKAQQKRMLGDMAIEEGNFGTSCFKKHAIQELFEPNKEPLVSDTVEVEEQPEEIKDKAKLNKFEQALIKCETDAGEAMDVDAIKLARADVDTDMREFDESIPLTEDNSPVEKSEKEQQIDCIVSQMTPVEQYAVKFLEIIHHDNFREELQQAEQEYIQELENKKSQWEQSRIDLMKEQAIFNEAKEEDGKTILTYPKGARCEHVQFMLDGTKKVEENMELWAPPTPPTSPPSPVEESNQFRHQPSLTPTMAARIHAMGGFGLLAAEFNKSDSTYFIDEKDVYTDYSTHFMYESNPMLESQLPPVNQAYTENEATSYTIGSKKIRLTGTPVVPLGYYQTPMQAPHLQQHLQNLTNVPAMSDGSSAVAGQQSVRKPKVRRDEVICLPRSLFDRPQGNQIKARRDLKLQKLRCVTKGNDSDPFAMQKFFHSFSLNFLGQSLPQETIEQQVSKHLLQYPNTIMMYHQEQLPPWTIQEEWAILMIIQHLQDLPVNLSILTPGHTPNWELVSEVITDVGFAHRSFKMCEYHYAREVQKREMTRDSSWDERALPSTQALDSPTSKKAKKQKNQQSSKDTNSSQQSSASGKSSAIAQPVAFKPSKTGSMLAHDKSLGLSFKERYSIIERIRNTRPKHPKSRYIPRERLSTTLTSLVRDDKRLIEYDRPAKPETIIMELAEERKRRALAARQAGHMMSMCGCCRTTSVTTSR